MFKGMVIDGESLVILLTESSGLGLGVCSGKNLTSAGTATPTTLRLRLHSMGAHAASVMRKRRRRASFGSPMDCEVIEG
jgi:hypothetical protein